MRTRVPAGAVSSAMRHLLHQAASRAGRSPVVPHAAGRGNCRFASVAAAPEHVYTPTGSTTMRLRTVTMLCALWLAACQAASPALSPAPVAGPTAAAPSAAAPADAEHSP